MSLPKRNGLIRVMYGLSMVGMFVFLGTEAISYTEKPTPQAAVKLAEPIANAPAPRATVSNVLPIQQNQPLRVNGLSTVLNLNGDIDAQISHHWLSFVESEQVKFLPLSREVYAVYSDYDSDRSTVSLTLGFIKQGPVLGAATATINKGMYLPVSGKTVLESWQKPDVSAQSLRYETDYEQWTLDKHYQPVGVTAHLGLR